MPEKYHINTTPVPPRLPRIGKHGIVDWREDCSRCHNCVKKACVYDRHRQESEYIRSLKYSDFLFFECMGCFSCVQNCTKDLLCLTVNSEYEGLGNQYWTPEIIHTTWQQAETASVPVSGAGYRGAFAGKGFDAMWTDMSEIVRPTRDGIHGREYISTSVDIGTKPSFLEFSQGNLLTPIPEILDIPMPMIIDRTPSRYGFPALEPYLLRAAALTGLLAVMDPTAWPGVEKILSSDERDSCLAHTVFHLEPGGPQPPEEILSRTRMAELPDSAAVMDQAAALKQQFPKLVVGVRVQLDGNGVERCIALAREGIEVIHMTADPNGNELAAESPRFIKEMIREVHTELIRIGVRDAVTLIAGGGIALSEHMAKAVICGADLVSVFEPLMIALECRLCPVCDRELSCPSRLDEMEDRYAVGRMRNLIASWHLQLIELMGAMGMREARRLRGDVGRAMFFEELEEEIFGTLFGTRN